MLNCRVIIVEFSLIVSICHLPALFARTSSPSTFSTNALMSANVYRIISTLNNIGIIHVFIVNI